MAITFLSRWWYVELFHVIIIVHLRFLVYIHSPFYVTSLILYTTTAAKKDDDDCTKSKFAEHVGRWAEKGVKEDLHFFLYNLIINDRIRS